MSKYRIRIFSDFSSCEGNKSTYEDLCMAHANKLYGPDKEIYITTDDDYTHAILINRAMPVLKPIPKENVVGFAFEPPQFLVFYYEDISYYQTYVGKYYIGDTYGILKEPFVAGHSYMWHCKPVDNLRPILERAPMSIMISEKKNAPGHKYRHALVERILHHGLPVDIYGRGCAIYRKNMIIDQRFKGAFNNDSEMIANYRFTIAIENYPVKWYFSEKLMNPLLYGTTPLYLGGEMVSQLFPGTFHRLTGNLDSDIAIITDVIVNPDKYQTNIDQASVRKSINLLENLDSVFSYTF